MIQTTNYQRQSVEDVQLNLANQPFLVNNADKVPTGALAEPLVEERIQPGLQLKFHYPLDQNRLNILHQDCEIEGYDAEDASEASQIFATIFQKQQTKWKIIRCCPLENWLTLMLLRQDYAPQSNQSEFSWNMTPGFARFSIPGCHGHVDVVSPKCTINYVNAPNMYNKVWYQPIIDEYITPGTELKITRQPWIRPTIADGLYEKIVITHN